MDFEGIHKLNYSDSEDAKKMINNRRSCKSLEYKMAALYNVRRYSFLKIFSAVTKPTVL
jgi:hypothetical protein